MLKKLKQFFPDTKNDKQDEIRSLRLSAATLMIEVLSADSVIDQREVEHTLKLLASRFEIAQQDLDDVFNAARKKSHDAISLQGFTREICSQFNNPERVQLLSMLWEIALVDETIDAHERHIIRKIAGLLYLNGRQIIQAKEMAKKSLS